MRIGKGGEVLVNYDDLMETFTVSRRTAERLVSDGVFVAREYQYNHKKWFDLHQCVSFAIHEVVQWRKLRVADYCFLGNQVYIALDHFKARVTKDLLQAVDVPAVA